MSYAERKAAIDEPMTMSIEFLRRATLQYADHRMEEATFSVLCSINSQLTAAISLLELLVTQGEDEP